MKATCNDVETQAPLLDATQTPVKAVKQGLQRRWRFPLWQIIGDGSTEDVIAGCLAWNMPVVTFGWNMKRALRLCFWKEIIKIILLLGGSYFLLSFAAHALVFSCSGWPKPALNGAGLTTAVAPAQHRTLSQGLPGCYHLDLDDLPPACRDRVVGGLAAIVLCAVAVVVTAVVYAARRRQQIREHFGIEGTFRGDVLSWTFCSVCALAQETRTLMAGQVEEGLWVNNEYSTPPPEQQMA